MAYFKGKLGYVDEFLELSYLNYGHPIKFLTKNWILMKILTNFDENFIIFGPNWPQMIQIFWTDWAIYLSILIMSSWVKWERSNRLNFPETIFFKSSYSSSLPFISQMWTLQHFFHSTSCSPGNFWKWMKMSDTHWPDWLTLKYPFWIPHKWQRMAS